VRVALVIAGKELRQRLRDRTAIFLAFIAPTLLAAIVTGAVGSAFGPGNADFNLRIGVADLDHSQLSRTFTQVLRSKPLKGIIGSTANVASADAAQSLVDHEKAAAAFVVPKGFQEKVARGVKADLTVIGRADDPIFRDIAEAIATGFTQQINATRISVFTTVRGRGGDISAGPALAAVAAKDRIPIQLEDLGIAVRKVSGANYFGPGMTMFFLFFIVGAGARSLFAEREQGTLPRILAAPARRTSILFGKAAATFVIGLMSMISTFATMRFIFGVHWGDPVAIAALTLLIVLALMAVTAVVQTLAKTEMQAGAYGSVVGMILALAGGSFFPLFQMPAFVQKVSALTPNGWALRGFTDIAYDGAQAADLLPNFAAIGAFIVVFGTIAAFNARRITLR
jgi:ABC-2 type transport system permease protein